MTAGFKIKTFTVVALTIAITILHYTTELEFKTYHLIYQGLYFVPVMLAGFWFGLRGALATSVSITILYVPLIVISWRVVPGENASRIMELALYNAVALVLGVIKDRELAEQKRSRESERLAAMGKAISSAAHDMRTPLIAIGGFTSLVQRKLAKMKARPQDFPAFADEANEKLAIVIKETRRLESMIKEMLDFSRPLELRRSPEDIGVIIEESFIVVEREAVERGVRLEKLTFHGDMLISCDSARMKQAIINLLMNAIQASPEGETVRISSRKNGGSLEIDVVDCGCGIPAVRKEEIFLPFVTTKKDGTGLGLPIVKKIVEAHQGRIEIVDNPDKGTTFRIVLFVF